MRRGDWGFCSGDSYCIAASFYPIEIPGMLIDSCGPRHVNTIREKNERGELLVGSHSPSDAAVKFSGAVEVQHCSRNHCHGNAV